jgi:hypothetical protein
MPRVCIRKGCAKDLLKRDGSPDFRRIFCGDECKKVERLEKLRVKRAAAAKGKCPPCGRRSSGDARFRRGVTRDTPCRTGVSTKAGRGVAKNKERRS